VDVGENVLSAGSGVGAGVGVGADGSSGAAWHSFQPFLVELPSEYHVTLETLVKVLGIILLRPVTYLLLSEEAISSTLSLSK
jgi:hypothetical protein